jgi:hypothetical protein
MIQESDIVYGNIEEITPIEREVENILFGNPMETVLKYFDSLDRTRQAQFAGLVISLKNKFIYQGIIQMKK